MSADPNTLTPDATPQAAITGDPSCCEDCGRQARVVVLEGYTDGRPRRRAMCLAHAAERAPQALRRQPGPRRPSITTLIGIAGGVGAMIGLLGDSLTTAVPMTFGWSQGALVAAGGLIIFVGALLRADFVALAGTLLFIGGLCAEWLSGAPAEGFGVRQQGFVVVGVALFAMPLFKRCWRALMHGTPQRA